MTTSTAADGSNSNSNSNNSTTNSTTNSSSLQALNWTGCIPIVLTLAPSSLSSPTMPPPIHVLISRQTFLHAGLEDAVRRLHPFAPTAVSFRAGLVRTEPDPGASASASSNSNTDDDTNKNNMDDTSGEQGEEGKMNKETATTQAAATDGSNRNPVQRSSSSDDKTTTHYPICWFEDEESQTALRWNLFTGVLYDLMNVQKRRPPTVESSSPSSSISSSSSSSSLIPWRIRLHFSAPYPTNQILPFDNANGTPLLMQVWSFYKNSLKQALCLQNGNSKAAMNLSKENHGRLWDAIRLVNFNLYYQVHREQLSMSASTTGAGSAHHPKRRIPTRLLVDGKPPRHASSLYSDALTLGMLLAQQLPNHFVAAVPKNDTTTTQPAAQQGGSSATATTFASTTTTKNNVANTIITIMAKDDCVVDWSVAGIVKPSLAVPVATFWENLCHADHFLYIIVHTTC